MAHNFDFTEMKSFLRYNPNQKDPLVSFSTLALGHWWFLLQGLGFFSSGHALSPRNLTPKTHTAHTEGTEGGFSHVAA